MPRSRMRHLVPQRNRPIVEWNADRLLDRAARCGPVRGLWEVEAMQKKTKPCPKCRQEAKAKGHGSHVVHGAHAAFHGMRGGHPLMALFGAAVALVAVSGLLPSG